MSTLEAVNCGGVTFWAVPLHLCRAVTSRGVYAFSIRRSDGSRYPLYFGKADQQGGIGVRVTPDHEQWRDALARGANEVLVHPLDNSQTMEALEARLIRFNNPPLNDVQPTADFQPAMNHLHNLYAFGQETGLGSSLLPMRVAVAQALTTPASPPAPRNDLLGWMVKREQRNSLVGLLSDPPAPESSTTGLLGEWLTRR